MSNKTILKNTFMLYILNIAKMVFPFLTFPYLTRVLSVDGYALVMYVRAAMQYLQIFVDFGFGLSATKHIVRANNNMTKIGYIVSDTILARILLAMVGGMILGIMIIFIPLLKQNILYTFLSFISVFLSCFFVDYLFNGLEKMHEITVRFVVLKGIVTILTFVLIHSDEDILLIPCLDILAFGITIILVRWQLYKYKIQLYWPRLRCTWFHIRDSFQYFISSMATTAFGALNTLLIGIFLPTVDVAVWTVAIQIVSIVQTLFTPIIAGMYPEMVRHKELKLIKKAFVWCMPMVLAGSLLICLFAPLIIRIVAGTKYDNAYDVLHLLVPVIIFSFPAMLLGWPSLGAIGKAKETSASTIIAAMIQCTGLGLLILWGHFTLYWLAILRGLTEGILCAVRSFLCYKYRKLFH